jgi:hypothetical protein
MSRGFCDYLLGVNHSFQADQDLARSMTAVEPSARASRSFLDRPRRGRHDCAGPAQSWRLAAGRKLC